MDYAVNFKTVEAVNSSLLCEMIRNLKNLSDNNQITTMISSCADCKRSSHDSLSTTVWMFCIFGQRFDGRWSKYLQFLTISDGCAIRAWNIIFRLEKVRHWCLQVRSNRKINIYDWMIVSSIPLNLFLLSCVLLSPWTWLEVVFMKYECSILRIKNLCCWSKYFTIHVHRQFKIEIYSSF
jgi:hypothetical protein